MEEKKTDEGSMIETPAHKILRPSPAKVDSSFVAPYGPNLHVSNHPVLAHKLSILRSSSTSPSSFRATLREITFHLGYEATSSLTTRAIPITVPGTNLTDHIEATGSKISQKIALIPILRSGLGMVDSMLELVEDARVHHIGMYRSKSLMPVQYYNRLPKKCEVDVAYILDPLIATSATIISVAGILKKWGVPEIHVISVIASKQGLSELLSHHPDVHVTLGHIDEELNADGDVLPGLGDSGDRLFGTGPVLEDEEELVHPSKRKRTGSLASEASSGQ
jgi:uracil phosphoribosyltransferase